MFPPLTTSQKDLIKTIDYLEISRNDRFDLSVFIFDPHKQIALVGGGNFEDPKYPQYEIRNKNLLVFLGQFGYPYIGGGIYLKKEEWRYKQFTVGKSIDSCFLFAKYDQSLPGKYYGENEVIVGTLLGMPKTACEAFGTDQELRSGPEYEAYRKYIHDEKILSYFIPSIANWREEVAYYKAVTEMMRMYAPKTYEELIEDKEILKNTT